MRSRTWAAVLAAVTLTTAFVAVPSSTASAAVPRIAVTGGKLTAGGAPFTFSGMNVYNANSDGTCWDSMATSLDAALTSIGPDIKVLRSWFFQDMATSNGVRDWTAFDRTISTAAAHGKYVLPVLGNQWNDCDTGYGFKTPTWYTSGYKTPDPKGTVSYRDWVAEFSARYGQNPNLLAIELLNEPETSTAAWPDGTCPSGSADLLRTWAADVSAVAKTAGARLISLGTIGSGQCGTSDTQYFDLHALPDVNLCSFHDYSPRADIPGDQWNGLQQRLDQCATLGKPLYVGETGIRPSDVGGTLPARADRFTAKLTAQVAAGSAGLIAWAWNSNGSDLNGYDIGPGDPALAALRLSAASAAAFVVDSAADSVDANVGDGLCSTAAGDCSLRAAVQEGNVAGAATIALPAGNLTLSLSGVEDQTADDTVGDLDVTAALSITGVGSSAITSSPTVILAGAGMGDRVLETTGGGSLALRGVSLRGGLATDGGGLAVTQGSADLSDVVVENGHARGAGGGVFVGSSGSLNISGVTIRSNTADGIGGGLAVVGTATGSGLTLTGNAAAEGGGMALSGAFDLTGPVQVSANEATIEGNGSAGGGGMVVRIADPAGAHRLAGATIENNTAADGGGIVTAAGLASWSLVDSTLRQNKAKEFGGGLRAVGDSSGTGVALVDVTVDNNLAGYNFGQGGLPGIGGGIADSSGGLTMNRVTVSNNEARGGQAGGIFSNGGGLGLMATNVTVSGNAATQFGNPQALQLFAGDTFEADRLTHVTVADNGPGVAVEGGQFTSSVITGSCQGSIGLLSNNRVTSSCHPTPGGTNRVVTDMKLGPLADNGGPTMTMPPLAGSPLVDPEGNADLSANCPAIDQRGVTRPQDGALGGNRTCDIGAVEVATPKILTVSTTGQGKVTSTPAGVNCPSTCNAVYPDGTLVTLTATAAAGWQLAGWGGACTGTGACSVTMADDRAVSATFEPLRTFPVTVSLSGTGRVTSAPVGIDCPGSCEASFRDSVVLTATPGPGQVFNGWGGACSGTETSCTLDVSAAVQVSAAFEPAPTFPVTVSITGTGRVTSEPVGIDCPAGCAANLGGTVVLTETPGAGQVFTGWGGACSGSATTCTLQVTQATEVTAGFRPTAAPVAIAGSDVTVDEGVQATLNGAGSSPDGLSLTYRWSVDAGPPQFGAVLTVAFGDQGSHSAVLSVCDTSGTCATDTAAITVRNVAPVIASRSATPILLRVSTDVNPLPAATAGFTLTASDVPADPLVYRWAFGDGGTATTTTGAATRAYSRLGAFTATATVDDGDGGAATASWVVNVMATGSCDPNAKESNKRYNIITGAWGGVGSLVTVPATAPTFTFNNNGAPVATGASVGPGDVMTLQRSGAKGNDAKQLQIGCGPGGTRYLQAFIPRLGQTLYLQEAALIRL